MTSGELSKVFGALMMMPRMDEVMKVDLGLDRKQVLLLAFVIENGLSETDGSGVQFFSKEDAEQLREKAKQALEKAGLPEVYAQLRSFLAK